MMANNKPTDKQKSALRKFGLTEREIDNLTFDQASAKLTDLIAKARARDEKKEPKPTPLPQKPQPQQQAIDYDYIRGMQQARLDVKVTLGEVDYSTGAIVAELMRERFDVWLNRRIQNQKISNIKKVSGEA